jgi:anthranilate phosphoribosyltransferase
METIEISDFGKLITRLINKENISREEAYTAFSKILNNQTSEIQQGAFLAALTAKAETKDEIAGCWEAIYNHDTIKVYPHVHGPIVENCGTGMDTFKTFNISTAASIIAACNGLFMARHGARALTSVCGTVDLAEHLGVDVECDPSITLKSLEQCGLALFNGMSSKIHPCALGRILSQIAFGSTLNIAASLASPVKADIGVRGVYSKAMIRPAIETMKEIGYKKAIVFHGTIDSMDKGIDEASVCGETWCAELKSDGSIAEFNFRPEDAGLATHSHSQLSPNNNIEYTCRDFIAILDNKSLPARIDAVALNAGMIFYAVGVSSTITEGIVTAKEIIDSGRAVSKLTEWVQVQNTNPGEGLSKLNRVKAG